MSISRIVPKSMALLLESGYRSETRILINGGARTVEAIYKGCGGAIVPFLLMIRNDAGNIETVYGYLNRKFWDCLTTDL